MAATFPGASKAAGADQIEKLHAKIGQLVVERDFFVEGVRAMSVEHLRQMIEREYASLSIVAQCRLVSISRSSSYYAPVAETAGTLALMEVIDASFLDHPWCGSRQMARRLQRLGHGAVAHPPASADERWFLVLVDTFGTSVGHRGRNGEVEAVSFFPSSNGKRSPC